MKFENTSVYNIYNAILGARNPMNSWDRSDSIFNGYDGKIENTEIGENDLKLAQTLIKAGSEHRKFLRQIFVAVDITAPSYFMAELDTYKIGVTRNSSSFQHKGTSKRFIIDDFEVDDEIKEVLRIKNKELYSKGYSQKQLSEMFEVGQAQISVICRDSDSTSENRELFEHCWYWEQILDTLNSLRDKYLETKDYKYFRLIRQLLPQSYLYRSTITMNYENILNMVHQRRNHKLTEWSESFINWVKNLPYAEELIFMGGVDG